jgi:hypothetical protein
VSDTTDIPDEVAQRLEAIRAERAALKSVIKARVVASPEEQIAAEERGLAGEKAFDEAQRKYGAKQVQLVATSEGSIVLRRPHWVAFRKFQDQKELTYDSAEELVKGCLIYPAQSVFDRLLEQQPGVMTKLASVCVELAGFKVDEVKAK